MKRLFLSRACFVAAILAIASPVLAQNRSPENRIADRDMRDFVKLVPGVYSNEEQVYFQENLGLPEAQRVPRMEMVIRRTGENFSITSTWENGRVVKARHNYSVRDGKIHADVFRFERADCSRKFTREFDNYRGDGCGGTVTVSPKGIRMINQQGTFNLLRARTFTCWASPQKADGSYAFYNDIVIHDQGGRAWIEATAEHPRVGLKMRNVRWPTGVNRDSMVLYTYEGDDADYSPSYVWGDVDAERLAINTRWLQASCTQGDAVYTPNLNLQTGSGN